MQHEGNNNYPQALRLSLMIPFATWRPWRWPRHLLDALKS